MNKERNIKIDVLKGLAVFLVLWGHSIQYLSQGKIDFFENIIFRFIYSFHMPLFMIISGYLFYYTCSKYSSIESLKKMLKNILYPLLIWNTIVFIIQGIHPLIGLFKGYNSLRDIYDIFIYSLSHLWFLWAVFYSSIGVIIVNKIFNRNLTRLLGYIIYFIILCVIPNNIIINKELVIWMMPYYLLAYLYNKNENKISSSFKSVCCVLSIPVFLLLFNYFHYDAYIYTSGFTNLISTKGIIYQTFQNIVRWGIGFVGSILIIFIVNYIISSFSNLSYKFTRYLGKYSLHLYVIQSIIIEFILIPFFNNHSYFLFVTSNIFLFNILYTFVFAIIFCIFNLLIIYIINKCHLNKFLFGR